MNVVEKNNRAQITQRKLLAAGRGSLGELMHARIAETGHPFKRRKLQHKSNFTNQCDICEYVVLMFKKFLPLLPVLLLAGCTTPGTFTKLTPGQQPRNPDNLYPVEAAFDSNQQSLRWDSIKAYILVDGQALPMRPVPMVDHRWEGLVPLPAGATSVTYRFKFDYLYNSLGSAPKPNSVTSKIYTLKVVEQ